MQCKCAEKVRSQVQLGNEQKPPHVGCYNLSGGGVTMRPVERLDELGRCRFSVVLTKFPPDASFDAFCGWLLSPPEPG